jgi:hypothetical protein
MLFIIRPVFFILLILCLAYLFQFRGLARGNLLLCESVFFQEGIEARSRKS